MTGNVELKLQKLLNAFTRRFWVEKLMPAIALIIVAFVALPLVEESYQSGLSALFVLVALAIVAVPYTMQRPKITLSNLAEHLNLKFDELEQSTQLLLKPTEDLNLLQRLQQEKVSDIFATLDKSGVLVNSLPPLRFKLSIALMIGAILIIFVSRSPNTELVKPPEKQPTLLGINVTVTPPIYTGLTRHQFSHGDIEIVEGSTVQWSLTWSGAVSSHALVFGDESPIKLTRQGLENQYVASKIITKTGLYQITGLPDIYSVSVIKDQKPKVRIVEPQSTLVTLAKNSEAKLTTKAIISDDYGIAKVEILASVAKGSGESVKFRDQVFAFDSNEAQIHSKSWDLKALGMAPGDELYFTVVVDDNKENSAQQGRSATVIVRWLDDEVQGIAAEGIMLDGLVEYFRSQRQIIIETEQLINDKKDLTQAKFTQTSISLGHSQSDLKHRYGQYLGDEVGEGPGDQLNTAALESETEQAHEHEHEHESADAHGTDLAFGSAQAVIAQVAHTHEAVHVGEVSAQNPKAMMKKAVGFMWQAELHLMLSEPQLALPFEKQAYKYVKLAKQAERIYVKRLGFEPPPVSEEKRLTGELEEIKSYHRNNTAQPAVDNDDELFRRAFTLLSFLQEIQLQDSQLQESQLQDFQLQDEDVQDEISAKQRAQLIEVKNRLSELAQNRPTLIKQAATIEKILLSNSVRLTNCDNCLTQLKQKVWQLISSPVSRPVAGQKNYLNVDPAIGDYQSRAGSND